MQGKALALALFVCLLLIGGCGGGESSSTQQGSDTSPAQATSPQGVKEAAGELKDNTERIKRERQGQEADQSKSTGPGPDLANSPDHGKSAGLPPAHPQNPHHDSGGGTAPFTTKSGDNSIQETGHQASASQTEEAAAVLHAYLDARIAHHWEEACFYLSAGYAATIEAFAQRYAKDKGVKSCSEVLGALATGSSQQALRASAQADVGALRIEGDHGFVLYRGPGGEALAMPMVIEGGAWKVGSLDGAPLG